MQPPTRLAQPRNQIILSQNFSLVYKIFAGTLSLHPAKGIYPFGIPIYDFS